MRHYIIPIFVPHLGCPHDCVFCNQDRITGAGTDVTKKEVEKTIEEYLSYFKKDAFIEVAFYGGSFTAIDMDIQRELLSVPYRYKKEGIIDEIRLSTRPDCINEDILDLLKEFDVDTVELGVQSMDMEVLRASARGHDVDSVYRAVEYLKDYKIKYGLQMMLGLPEDNMEKSLYTAKKFIELDPACVRIYPTLVIKDTFLLQMEEQGRYKPMTLEEAIDASTIILGLFYLNDLNVIRVGLQPTENIQLGKDVVSGPFHSAFRQLVESNMNKRIIENYILENKLELDKNISIRTNPKNVSNIAGQKSTNIEYFKEKFGLKDIKIHGDNKLLEDIVIVSENRSYRINIREGIKDYLRNYFKTFKKYKLEDFNIK